MADASNSPSGASTSSASGEFDPRYSAEDATLVIVSSDGVKFKVHPLMLRMSSEVFNDMLTRAVDTGEPITLSERSSTIRKLLDFIYPDGPSLDFAKEDFYSIWNLLAAADKYGIQKIQSDLRLRVVSDPYFKDQPMQAFVISSRMGWDEVMDRCSLDAIDKLDHPESYKYMMRLDSTSLLKLHRFADMYRRAHLEVVEGTLGMYYSFDPAKEDEWDDEEKFAHEATKAVMTYARAELLFRPSGRKLHDALMKSEAIQKYLFRGWENEYFCSLSVYDHLFPNTLSNIVMVLRDDRYDDGI